MSNSKPRLLFGYDVPKEEYWQDGLRAALTLLEEDFDITYQNVYENFYKDCDQYDVIVGWGGFGSWPDRACCQIRNSAKKVLLLGGNATPLNADKYDLIFAETDWAINNYLKGVKTKVIKAFGVNTDIFNRIDIPTPIVWDYLGVGAFAAWKRWEKMLDKKGSRLVIGEYQKANETESLSIARNLLRGGVMVSDMVSPLDLSLIYHYARTVYIPADINGGGERSVLEAKASGCAVEVEPDNAKLRELVELEVVPSHYEYYKALKDGINSIL